MKIVLDTNVLISGIFFTGTPFRILELWRAGRFRIILSEEIYGEYCRVVAELAAKFDGLEADAFLELIFSESEIIDAPSLGKQICEDPDDDKFFAAAVAGGAKVIVSGDHHLLKAGGFRNIEVVRPREFLDRMRAP